ncbi:hypothetical protein CSUI_003600 [Cystoisospora suis]|uniref:Transmembrane protein n=1 Tax=Cystoisospora suis TaxID=483139 RepID=A0A2C6L482_9APIC|nr:hypothetical protein CSUI_003600 [Cystoisospora suis]
MNSSTRPSSSSKISSSSSSLGLLYLSLLIIFASGALFLSFLGTLFMFSLDAFPLPHATKRTACFAAYTAALIHAFCVGGLVFLRRKPKGWLRDHIIHSNPVGVYAASQLVSLGRHASRLFNQQPPQPSSSSSSSSSSSLREVTGPPSPFYPYTTGGRDSHSSSSGSSQAYNREGWSWKKPPTGVGREEEVAGGNYSSQTSMRRTEALHGVSMTTASEGGERGGDYLLHPSLLSQSPSWGKSHHHYQQQAMHAKGSSHSGNSISSHSQQRGRGGLPHGGRHHRDDSPRRPLGEIYAERTGQVLLPPTLNGGVLQGGGLSARGVEVPAKNVSKASLEKHEGHSGTEGATRTQKEEPLLLLDSEDEERQGGESRIGRKKPSDVGGGVGVSVGNPTSQQQGLYTGVSYTSLSPPVLPVLGSSPVYQGGPGTKDGQQSTVPGGSMKMSMSHPTGGGVRGPRGGNAAVPHMQQGGGGTDVSGVSGGNRNVSLSSVGGPHYSANGDIGGNRVMSSQKHVVNPSHAPTTSTPLPYHSTGMMVSPHSSSLNNTHAYHPAQQGLVNGVGGVPGGGAYYYGSNHGGSASVALNATGGGIIPTANANHHNIVHAPNGYAHPNINASTTRNDMTREGGGGFTTVPPSSSVLLQQPQGGQRPFVAVGGGGTSTPVLGGPSSSSYSVMTAPASGTGNQPMMVGQPALLTPVGSLGGGGGVTATGGPWEVSPAARSSFQQQQVELRGIRNAAADQRTW